MWIKLAVPVSGSHFSLQKCPEPEAADFFFFFFNKAAQFLFFGRNEVTVLEQIHR